MKGYFAYVFNFEANKNLDSLWYCDGSEDHAAFNVMEHLDEYLPRLRRGYMRDDGSVYDLDNPGDNDLAVTKIETDIDTIWGLIEPGNLVGEPGDVIYAVVHYDFGPDGSGTPLFGPLCKTDMMAAACIHNYYAALNVTHSAQFDADQKFTHMSTDDETVYSEIIELTKTQDGVWEWHNTDGF